MPRKEPARDEDLNEEEREWREVHDPTHLLNINQIKYRLQNSKRDAEVRARNAKLKEQQKLLKEQEAIEKAAKKTAQKLIDKAEKQRIREEKRIKQEHEKELAKLQKSREKELDRQEVLREKQAQEAIRLRRQQQQATQAKEGGGPSPGMSLEEYIRKAKSMSGQATVEDLISILHARLVLTSQNLELRPQDYMAAIRMLRDIQEADTPKTEEDPYAVAPMSPEDLAERTMEVILVYMRIWEQQHARYVRWLEPILQELFTAIFLNHPLPEDSSVQWLIEHVQPFFGHPVKSPAASVVQPTSSVDMPAPS